MARCLALDKSKELGGPESNGGETLVEITDRPKVIETAFPITQSSTEEQYGYESTETGIILLIYTSISTVSISIDF